MRVPFAIFKLPLPSYIFSIFVSTFFLVSSLGSIGFLIQYSLLLFTAATTRRISPLVGFIALALTIFLSVPFSDSFDLIRIIPSFGFFFCGPIRPSVARFFSSKSILLKTEYSLQSISLFIAATSISLIPETIASHNILSLLLLLLFLYYILAGNVTKGSRILISLLGLVLFLFFKNRSALLALLILPLPTFPSLILFLSVLSLVLLSYIPTSFLFTIPLFQPGGFLYRQPDTRMTYALDALSSDLSLTDLSNKPSLLVTPVSKKGYPDFHNSFLTNLYRDRFFGLLKTLLLLILSFFQPLSFAGFILLRSMLDSIFLGSVYDVLLWPTLTSTALVKFRALYKHL